MRRGRLPRAAFDFEVVKRQFTQAAFLFLSTRHWRPKCLSTLAFEVVTVPWSLYLRNLISLSLLFVAAKMSDIIRRIVAALHKNALYGRGVWGVQSHSAVPIGDATTQAKRGNTDLTSAVAAIRVESLLDRLPKYFRTKENEQTAEGNESEKPRPRTKVRLSGYVLCHRATPSRLAQDCGQFGKEGRPVTVALSCASAVRRGRNFVLKVFTLSAICYQTMVKVSAHTSNYAPAAPFWKLTSTWRRSSSETLNMERGFRFMKLATNTSGIWPMRVL